MPVEVKVALISLLSAAIVALIGYFGNRAQSRAASKDMNASVRASIEVSQAVTDTKLEDLTAEVRKHNNFAERIPTMEADIRNMKEDIKELKSQKP